MLPPGVSDASSRSPMPNLLRPRDSSTDQPRLEASLRRQMDRELHDRIPVTLPRHAVDHWHSSWRTGEHFCPVAKS